MIAKVEQGTRAPSPKSLASLAIALDVEPEELARRANTWELAMHSVTSTAALRAIALGAVILPSVAAAPAAITLGAAAMLTMNRRRQFDQLLNRVADPVVRADFARFFGIDLTSGVEPEPSSGQAVPTAD